MYTQKGETKYDQYKQDILWLKIRKSVKKRLWSRVRKRLDDMNRIKI